MKRQRQAHSPHTIGRVQDTTQSVSLRNFGITDTTELETLEAFFLNSVKYGSDSLKSGLANMFEGMQNASELHSQMTTEIHTLYEGIVAMKRDILEAKEQGLAAETIAIQATEVTLFVSIEAWQRMHTDSSDQHRRNAILSAPITIPQSWR